MQSKETSLVTNFQLRLLSYSDVTQGNTPNILGGDACRKNLRGIIQKRTLQTTFQSMQLRKP